MKTHRAVLISGLIALASFAAGPLSLHAADAAAKVRVLVVTGGHDYETNQFLQVFRDNAAITFQHATHPQAHAWLAADRAKEWDVLVLYDMWQDISDAARKDFEARLAEGKGLVVTHHAIANYQQWPAYEQIIGAKYYLEPTTRGGVAKARSLWKHDVQFRVAVKAPDHPVTRGVADFDIHDETYNLFDVASDVTVLLGTQEATSGPKLAWAKTWQAARVVYLQLGHDHLAYENPHYRRVLANAIRWTARRD
jgi:type 1 glutamine amidotransferase